MIGTISNVNSDGRFASNLAGFLLSRSERGQWLVDTAAVGIRSRRTDVDIRRQGSGQNSCD